MKKIDFMGVGFARCGTTSISKNLANHPQISLYSEKDTEYFCTLNEKDLYKKEGIKGYYKLLELGNMDYSKLCGEFCPLYAHDLKAMKRIKKHFPDIKIIIITRNPIDRFISHYSITKLNNLYLNGKPSKDLSFKQFIKENPIYLEMGNYQKYVDKIKKDFKAVLILRFEDYINFPLKTMKEIYTFLNVDPNFISNDLNKKFNQSRIFKGNQGNIMKISRVFNYLESMGFPVKRIRFELNKIYNRKQKETNIKKIKLSKSEIEYLENYYKKSES